jgi:photosystem II stability/assembly factor-like uncharacterized protein
MNAKNVLFCSILLLVFMAPAVAQTWEPLGPEGGSFAGIVTDPADANTVTAICNSRDYADVFRTADGGMNWDVVGSHPLSSTYAFSAFDFDTIYCLGYDFKNFIYKCLRTTDGGKTWTTLNFSAGLGRPNVLCVHPTDPDTVFAAGYTRAMSIYHLVVFKSTNGGKDWTAIRMGMPNLAYPYGMAISRSNPDVMYIVGYMYDANYTMFSMVFRSTDGGATWDDISALVEPAPSTYLTCLAIDPTDENRVYTAYRSVYRTTDGGATWIKDSSHVFNCQGIGIDPVNPANVYLGGSGDAFVSKDHGQTWTACIDAINGFGNQVHVSPADPGTVFITGDNCGVNKSTDHGATWFTAHSGIDRTQIAALAVAPSRPETVYMDLADVCELKVSHDSGENWQGLSYPYGCSTSISQLLVNSKDANLLMAMETG